MWIAVDQEYLLLRDSEARGEIDSRCGLAYPALLIRDCDDFGHLGLVGSMPKVGRQYRHGRMTVASDVSREKTIDVFHVKHR